MLIQLLILTTEKRPEEGQEPPVRRPALLEGVLPPQRLLQARQAGPEAHRRPDQARLVGGQSVTVLSRTFFSHTSFLFPRLHTDDEARIFHDRFFDHLMPQRKKERDDLSLS